MSAYARVQDVLPCPDTTDGRHDWIDARNSSDELYSGECSYCAALLVQRWWGWEFYTGEEHFDHDAWTFDEIRAITRPHRRGLLADEENVENVPMRFDPIPANIGQATRAIYRPQELGAPDPDPHRDRFFPPEDFNEGPLVRFLDEPPPENMTILGRNLVRVRGGENWGVYADAQAINNAIDRAQEAPRRGEYAQAFVRGLQAARAQLDGLVVRDQEGHVV